MSGDRKVFEIGLHHNLHRQLLLVRFRNQKSL